MDVDDVSCGDYAMRSSSHPRPASAPLVDAAPIEPFEMVRADDDDLDRALAAISVSAAELATRRELLKRCALQCLALMTDKTKASSVTRKRCNADSKTAPTLRDTVGSLAAAWKRDDVIALEDDASLDRFTTVLTAYVLHDATCRGMFVVTVDDNRLKN